MYSLYVCYHSCARLVFLSSTAATIRIVVHMSTPGLFCMLRMFPVQYLAIVLVVAVSVVCKWAEGTRVAIAVLMMNASKAKSMCFLLLF